MIVWQIGFGGMADERDCRALACNVGRFSFLPASVCDISGVGVEDEEMSKKKFDINKCNCVDEEGWECEDGRE